MHGYFPNSFKTNLIVKAQHEQKARDVFQEIEINITVDEKRYLGGAIVTRMFTEDFFKSRVQEWVKEVERLSQIARSQPHSAYAVLTHGLVGHWTYLCKLSEVPENLLEPLEKVIQESLLPNFTGQPAPSVQVRRLLGLPTRHGGLGIVNPVTLPSVCHKDSVAIAEPLVQLIIDQSGDSITARALQRGIEAQCTRERHAHQKASAESLVEELPGTCNDLLKP